jgi:hypothetical protein
VRGTSDCDRARGAAAVDTVTPNLFTDPGGEPTLEDLITGVWEGLAAHHRVACPLCGGEMTAVFSAHARPVAGRCGDCATELS